MPVVKVKAQEDLFTSIFTLDISVRLRSLSLGETTQ